MNIKFTLLFSLIILVACTQSTKMTTSKSAEIKPKEILLFGTFHFHNPGADVAKTADFDILNAESQKELEQISNRIKKFKPSKIFVEWPYHEQAELDELYQKYLGGNYFQDSTLTNFERKNEIVQLAFRTAEKLDLKQLHAIDYNDTEFPFDSMMNVMAENRQQGLQDELMNLIQNFTYEYDGLISSGASLKEILYFLNSESMRKADLSFYTQLATQAGDQDDFTGAYLASEWYRRNIYMWSLMQKAMTENDERIMVLLGSSHVAVLEQLLAYNANWKTIELRDLMN